ncbi:MAG: GMC family oxidoreductase N-terminal domain-containing protein, partial [Deltaproteobacteria bacterium]|nr:GMC family oxidoreductase N-terminal domain-containing protein [Deltaproteobacteria bacterium]
MDEYDYIVIGSGSAGAIVAARLAEDPDVSVLLLEAGGSDRTTFVRKPGMISLVQQVKQLKEKLDWGFSTVPQANLNDRRITYTRGKVVGGSSSVNGMIYLRGNKENYNDWAARGCDGWSFEDVLPFYKKLEDHEDGETEYHGAGGPIRVTRHPEDQLSPVSGAFLKAVSAVCDIPILDDFNAENQNCASIMQMSCSNGVRSGTGEAYVQPSLSRPNFNLQMRALVHRVVIENGRAVGVEYEQSGNRVVARANREVILSGGAIGSPHLLMLSGVGPADHLREHGIEVQLDVPGVGKNLHDHILVPLVFRAPTSLHRGTPTHFLGGMMKEYMVGKSWFGRQELVRTIGLRGLCVHQESSGRTDSRSAAAYAPLGLPGSESGRPRTRVCRPRALLVGAADPHLPEKPRRGAARLRRCSGCAAHRSGLSEGARGLAAPSRRDSQVSRNLQSSGDERASWRGDQPGCGSRERRGAHRGNQVARRNGVPPGWHLQDGHRRHGSRG